MEKPVKIDKKEALKWMELTKHYMEPFLQQENVLRAAIQAELDIPDLFNQADINRKEAERVAAALKNIQFEFNEERNRIKKETVEIAEQASEEMEQKKAGFLSTVDALKADIEQLRKDKTRELAELSSVQIDIRKEKTIALSEHEKLAKDRKAELDNLDSATAKAKEIAERAKKAILGL